MDKGTKGKRKPKLKDYEHDLDIFLSDVRVGDAVRILLVYNASPMFSNANVGDGISIDYETCSALTLRKDEEHRPEGNFPLALNNIG
jgi:hypothetical protein